MSILSSVTSVLEPIKNLGIPSEECKPTKSDDRGDDKHKGREEWKNDDHEKQAKNDDHSKHAKDDDHSKHAKDDDHSKHAKDDDHSKHAKDDDHSKHAKDDDHSKHAKDDDHSRHAKDDDCQPHKDDCQPQKDHCDTKPSDDCGKGDTYHNPGEALAKLDFSHGDYGSHGPDHSGDLHGALASMSSDHALDYAIGQMGPADHFDVGHFDVPADTSHDMVHHA
jgi:hypothetical protein